MHALSAFFTDQEPRISRQAGSALSDRPSPWLQGPGRKPHPRQIGGRSVLSGGPFSAPGRTARPSRSPSSGFRVQGESPSQHVFTEATFRLGF